MTPDTSKEDAAFVDSCIGACICFMEPRASLLAACRKAREPKPDWSVVANPGGTTFYTRNNDTGKIVSEYNGLTEAQARAVAEALNNLERGK